MSGIHAVATLSPQHQDAFRKISLHQEKQRLITHIIFLVDFMGTNSWLEASWTFFVRWDFVFLILCVFDILCFWRRQLQAGHAGQGGEAGQLRQEAALQLLLDRASAACWHLDSVNGGSAWGACQRGGINSFDKTTARLSVKKVRWKIHKLENLLINFMPTMPGSFHENQITLCLNFVTRYFGQAMDF